MGIFNFIKEAGRKLFDHDARAAAPAASPEQQLVDRLRQLKLGIEDPHITLQGDTAVLEGRAASQEEMEKAVLLVGNTQGIARVESRVTLPQAEKQPRFHTVQKGDTLSKIAKEAYGNANRYPEIFAANRPLLKDPDDIFPGQVLRIPDLAGEPA